MFENALRSYLRPSPPRISTPLTGYINTLATEVRMNLHRYTRIRGSENSGMMLLEQILGNANIDDIIAEPDPYRRYQDFVAPMTETLERVFDPTQIGSHLPGSFVDQSHHHTRQYIFPTRTSNAYTDLPLDKNWLAWSRVRPLRVLDIRSTELTFHSYQDVLKFRNDPPTRVVFGLDVQALVLMYAVYKESVSVPEESQRIPMFLHQYVIYPALVEDATQIWLRNQYIQCLTQDQPETKGWKDYVWVTANNGRIGVQFPRFVDELFYLKSQVQSGAISPPVLLSTMQLLHGDSINQVYLRLTRLCHFPQERQYFWSEYLAFEGWIHLYISVAVLYPEWSDFKLFARYLIRDLSYLKMAHPWSGVSHADTRSFIETSIDAHIETLKAHLPETA